MASSSSSSSSYEFLLLFVSLVLLISTTVSAENQILEAVQDVIYPPPLTKPTPPAAKPNPPTLPPVTQPPTPPVTAPPTKPYTPAPKVPPTPVVTPPTPVVTPPTPVVTPPTPVVTPPTPYRPPVKKQDCGTLCLGRCKLHSRPALCLRACSTCCLRCKCVPPGTYGNRELCGKCYTEMRTHGNRYKCP